MAAMNVSLPESLKVYVDKQVVQGGYSTSSEYVRELIRRDQDRTLLRSLLLEGAASASGQPADKTYFGALRRKIRQRARTRK